MISIASIVLGVVCLLPWAAFAAEPGIFNTENWIPLTGVEETNKANYPPPTSTWKNDDTDIFVGISSFRDKRCGLTLLNLFKKAKNPDRVRVGVVQQIHTEDDHFDCIKDYCAMLGFRDGNYREKCPHFNQIHTIVFSYLDSRGPGYARHMQQSLIQNEEFCLQLDSHVDSVENWDQSLLEMWGSVGNEYAVLSTRLPDVSALEKNDNRNEVPHLCQATFTDSGSVRVMQPRLARHLSSPLLAPLWSAGFSFSKCHMEKKVPYDPQLLFLFDGEEINRYARMWTRGYDVYTPNKVVFAHDYSAKLTSQIPSDIGDTIKMDTHKKYAPDMGEWSVQGSKPYRSMSFDTTLLRLRVLLGMKSIPSQPGWKTPSWWPSDPWNPKILATLTRYGLGTRRSLEQFAEFTGLDFKNGKAFADRCIELKWVQFTADSDPHVEDGSPIGYGPEVQSAGDASIPLLSHDYSVIRLDNNYNNNNINNNDVDSNSNSNSNNNNLRGPGPLSSSSSPSSGRGAVVSGISLGPIDTAIDSLVAEINKDLFKASGQANLGHKVVKVLLLGAPVFFFVVFAAVHSMNQGIKYPISETKKV